MFTGALRAAALALFGSCLVTAAPAQTPPPQPPHSSAGSSAQAVARYRFRVLGVYDDATGVPVEGVEVRDVLTGTSSLTTSTGTVSLIFLPDGGGLVRLRKLGYAMQTVMVAISPADTTPLTILLQKAVQLPVVNVRDSASTFLSPSLKNAEARMRSGMGGYFIGEAEMRKQDNTSLASALLSRIPAIMLTNGPHGETYVVSSRQPCKGLGGGCKNPNCYISVFVDGVPATVSGQSDFQRMLPSDYAIAEFYPGASTLPVQFGSANKCGTLLLWSRER